jgi:Mn2+/Fe2+ NRAMP family transporter
VPLETLDTADSENLRGWLRQMTLDTSVAVIGGTAITTAFLILGAELLRPNGLVPEESELAGTLGRLLGDVWGLPGFWFMIVSLFVALWVTVLSNPDGFGRLFADGSRILLDGMGVRGRWTEPKHLRRIFLIALLVAAPISIYWAVGKPVTLLKIAGAIEAMHIPVLTGLVLYLNRRTLPAEFRPGNASFTLAVIAGLFFVGFTVVYLAQLVKG